MSIIVSNIRRPFDEDERAAIEEARRIVGLSSQEICAQVFRVSLDARRGQIFRVYSVRIDGIPNEKAFAEQLQMPFVRYKSNAPAVFPQGSRRLAHPPVVVGLGPAGLFAAYLLAKNGYLPIVLERGDNMDDRDRAVERFHRESRLDTESNIQFGEGGAGAYSDGKLTTRIGDPLCETVLEVLRENGAPEEITRLAKPHIGTDILKSVVQNMRREIVRLGGTVQFRARVTGVQTKNGRLQAVNLSGGSVACERAVFALGHSARDTVQALAENEMVFSPKPFSIGVRIEHLQNDLDAALYGDRAGHPLLPPAEYTLSDRSGGHACYSFCMCPGGEVVAAQSEENTVVTNGMSYHARRGKNANAALAVAVAPEDYADGTPFGGMALQRRIERAAFAQTGNYCAPCQRVGDFLQDRASSGAGRVQPSYPLGVCFGQAAASLPPFAVQALKNSLPRFNRTIRGFAAADALLTGPETRTSSPVRMERDGNLFAPSAQGLIPCGEGAGYAGGIMSAAVDGLRAAAQIMKEYMPLTDGKEK